MLIVPGHIAAMFKLLNILPLHLLSFAVYAAIAYGAGPAWFDLVMMSMTLPSGAYLVITGADFMVMMAVGFLLMEFVKASQTDWVSIANHALSSIMFLCAFCLFITIPAFGTSAWLIITSLMFVDMLGGWAVTAFAARRDFGFGG